MDAMEEVIEDMDRFSYNDFWQTKYDSLKDAVSRMDVDECMDILDSWK
jgi:hypothetical protein